MAEKGVTLILIGKLILVLSLLSAVESEFNFINAIHEEYGNGGPSEDYEQDGNMFYSNIGSRRSKRETIKFGNDVVFIPDNYSIHEPPPTINGTPSRVDFYILIIDIRDINEVQEEMTLEMNLQIYWRDPRLSHWAVSEKRDKNIRFGVLNPALIKDVWHPDIFIDHVKKIDQPKVISVPASLRFYYKDSTFRYSGRYTMKFGCQMVFQYYPADTQRCGIEVKSYSYSADTLYLNWRDGKKPAIKKGLTLPNFKLALGNPEEFWLNTSSSSYSGIRFAVILRRHLGFHLIQTYLLSCLFVILSFLTFLVAHESVLECMALCMTTLLTLTAMFAAVKQNTPTVSYVKGLDIWMVTCIFSVFFILVEHTVLLRMRTGTLCGKIDDQPNNPKYKRRSIFSISKKMRKETSQNEPLTMYYHKCSNKCKCSSGGTSDNSPIMEIRRNTGDRTSSCSTSALWRNDYISSIPTFSPSITPTLSPVRSSRGGINYNSMSGLLDHNYHQHNYNQCNGTLPSRSISGLSRTEHNGYNTQQHGMTSNNASSTLPSFADKEARKKYLKLRRVKRATNAEMFFSKLIPICFLIFNCIYWPWLLRSADYYNDTEFENTRYV